jgi:hypothetical protein
MYFVDGTLWGREWTGHIYFLRSLRVRTTVMIIIRLTKRGLTSPRQMIQDFASSIAQRDVLVWKTILSGLTRENATILRGTPAYVQYG